MRTFYGIHSPKKILKDFQKSFCQRNYTFLPIIQTQSTMCAKRARISQWSERECKCAFITFSTDTMILDIKNYYTYI